MKETSQYPEPLLEQNEEKVEIRMEKIRYFKDHINRLLIESEIRRKWENKLSSIENLTQVDEVLAEVQQEIERFMNTIWSNRGKVSDNALDDDKKDCMEKEIPRDRSNDIDEVNLFRQQDYDDFEKKNREISRKIEEKKKEIAKAKKIASRGRSRSNMNQQEILWQREDELRELEKEKSLLHKNYSKFKDRDIKELHRDELKWTEKVSKIAEFLKPDEFAAKMMSGIEEGVPFYRKVLKSCGLKDLDQDELEHFGVSSWMDLSLDNLKELGFKNKEELEQDGKHKGFSLESVFITKEFVKAVRKTTDAWHKEHQNEDSMREYVDEKNK